MHNNEPVYLHTPTHLLNTEPWFVVRTKSRSEKKVHQELLALGYTSFLPLETTIRVWSDRKKKVETPLISSVVFVQNPTCSKDAIYKIPGVYALLNVSGKLAIVKPQEIEHLRILTSEDVDYESAEIGEFKNGDEIQIVGGPFQGFFAKAIESTNTYRVLIEIPTLGIGYKINIAKNKVRKTL